MKLTFDNFNAAMECWNGIEQGNLVIEGPRYFRLRAEDSGQFSIITGNVSVLTEKGLHASNRLPTASAPKVRV